MTALEDLRTRLLPAPKAAELIDQLAQGRLDLMDAAAEVFQRLPAALMDLDPDARPLLAELTGALALFSGEAVGEDGAAERRRVQVRWLPPTQDD